MYLFSKRSYKDFLDVVTTLLSMDVIFLEPEKKEENAANDDDEFNVSLAKMEEEIKPKIINILDSLNKNYFKLKKYQIEKLECLLN